MKHKSYMVCCLIIILLLSGCVSQDVNLNDKTAQTTAVNKEISSEITATRTEEITYEMTRENKDEVSTENATTEFATEEDTTNDILFPGYNGEAYVMINNNMPAFSDEEKHNTESFEEYSQLDSKGRCGVAFANVCKETMPTAKRGDIGDIRPSGWHTVKYPGVIEDNYLYNRSHLIAYSLAGENDNEKNLITGTRYLNQETMQIFELQVLDYIRDTDNHVLYRVTPFFDGDNLLATGVQMEAWSVEDEGEGVCFNVFCYNVQPHIEIDYATGDSREVEGSSTNSRSSQAIEKETDFENMEMLFILNTNTMKIHLPDCKSISSIKDKNRQDYEGTLNELKERGYSPCGNCLPSYR